MEKCVVSGIGKGPYFHVERGVLKASSEATFPAVTPDRLALVSASGMAVFRPVFDALMGMGFYNLNPKLMRDPQKPQDGRMLKPVGENIVSVIGHLERVAVVLANREYEAWFIAAAESLNGCRGFQCHANDVQVDQEIPRNAKAWVRERMPAWLR